MLLAPLLLAAAGPAATPPVDVVAGLRLGDSEAVATRRIRRFGPVERQLGDGGAVSLTAGDAAATICQDQVVSVVLVIGRSLHDFARSAQFFLRTHGPAQSPEIYALPASRSAAGTAVASDIVRLKWANAPAFSLAYSEAGDTHRVFVALNAPNPCTAAGDDPAPPE